MLAVSILLLIVLGVYATIAWYTRLTNVTGLTFDAADFDFRAQYVTDSFIINVNDYLNIKGQEAAPGTGGIIPVLVSAEASETAVDYSMNINREGMAPEFAERIRFFYYTKAEDGTIREHTLGNGTADIHGTLPPGTQELTEYLYWEWQYTADITPVLEAPDGQGGWTSYETIDEMSDEDLYNALYNWEKALAAENGDEVKARYEELKSNGHLANVDPGNPQDVCMDITNSWGTNAERGANIRQYLTTKILDPWDKVDSNVGLGLWNEKMVSRNNTVYQKDTVSTDTGDVTYKAYQMAMQVQLQVSGVQAKPIEGTGDGAIPTGTTVLKPVGSS